MSEESNAVKRIRTTMIGAIDAVEKVFAEEMSDPQFKSKFNVLRKEKLEI